MEAEVKRAPPPSESEQPPKRHAPDGGSSPSSEDAPSAIQLPSSPGAATAAAEGLPSPPQPSGEAAAPLAAEAVAAHPPFTGQLPPPTLELRELARRVVGRLKEWNMTQSALCVQLALSPVYLSCWLRERELPKATKQLYSSALEAWMADPHFNIQDPSITGTPATQVARPCRGRGRGAGGGGGARGGRASRPSPSASRASGGGESTYRRRTAHGVSIHAHIHTLVTQSGGALDFQLLADASTRPRPLREISAAFVLVTASLRRDALAPPASAEGGGEATVSMAEGEADATLLFRVGGRRLASLGADDVLVEEDALPHDRGRGSRLRRTLVEMAANAPAGGMAPFAGELGAICAVCDQRFERSSGALQLCAHAALHLLHENQELRRRCELNPALAALRGAANVEELRAALDVCRRLTAEVPDVPLQRATFKAERRLRTMVANKNRPPPVVPPAAANVVVPPLPRARVAAPPAVAPHRQAHLPTALPQPPPTWLPSPSLAAEHANSCIGQKPASAAAVHRPLSSSCGGVSSSGERGAAGQAGEGLRHTGASRTPSRVEEPTQLPSKLPHAPPHAASPRSL